VAIAEVDDERELAGIEQQRERAGVLVALAEQRLGAAECCGPEQPATVTPLSNVKLGWSGT
jgi:hypothetical protein